MGFDLIFLLKSLWLDSAGLLLTPIQYTGEFLMILIFSVQITVSDQVSSIFFALLLDSVQSYNVILIWKYQSMRNCLESFSRVFVSLFLRWALLFLRISKRFVILTLLWSSCWCIFLISKLLCMYIPLSFVFDLILGHRFRVLNMYGYSFVLFIYLYILLFIQYTNYCIGVDTDTSVFFLAGYYSSWRERVL